jgi:NACalpha-BTF3-like transcription factor
MSYYKIIDGKKMDGHLIEIAQQAIKNIGDGRISLKDAESILTAVKDGNVYTDIEKATIAHIRKNFNWTEAADEWFRTQISKWRAHPKKIISMTPQELASEHFSFQDVLRNEEDRITRKHDLHTAMNETNNDHDDIGLIVHLATGERVEVLSSFIELSGDFVELKGGCIIPVHTIEKVEI